MKFNHIKANDTYLTIIIVLGIFPWSVFLSSFYSFIYLFLAVLGLRYCVVAPLVAASKGCRLVAVHELPIVVTSLVAKAQALGCRLQ